jgi:hypothetical protein
MRIRCLQTFTVGLRDNFGQETRRQFRKDEVFQAYSVTKPAQARLTENWCWIFTPAGHAYFRKEDVEALPLNKLEQAQKTVSDYTAAFYLHFVYGLPEPDRRPIGALSPEASARLEEHTAALRAYHEASKASGNSYSASWKEFILSHPKDRQATEEAQRRVTETSEALVEAINAA